MPRPLARLRATLAALLVALFALACRTAAAPAPRTRPPPLVAVAPLAPRVVRDEVRAPVELRPLASAELAAKVPGYLDRVLVERGDAVTRGQLLAVVRPSDLPEQLGAARGALEQNDAALALARDNLTRAEALAPRGVLSQQELAQARAAVAAAEAQRAALRSQLAAVRTRLGEHRIVAPMSGVVAQRRYDPGALVGTAGSGAILTVARTDVLRAFVPVLERDLARVRVGTPVELTVSALPERVFTGSVARLAPSVDAATRTLDAEVHLPNPDGALRPGMFGRASLVTAVRAAALTVPASAVQLEDERRYVFVLAGADRVARRLVETGVDGGDWLEVRAGLAPGDALVTAGLDALSDGARVRVSRASDPLVEGAPGAPSAAPAAASAAASATPSPAAR